MICTDCIGSCTSYYHAIKTTTASNLVVCASNKLHRIKIYEVKLTIETDGVQVPVSVWLVLFLLLFNL